ncbi:UNVERIFIED_CONTAM: hypothetical protein GTU68_053536 [Idotea baltica]|nr:hypothetical protein [Idotea baltica]
MIALVQRVTSATVSVKEQNIARIDRGILALIGIEVNDTPAHADRLLHRLLGYRIFEDANEKMNLSLDSIDGGLLLVPQFTLTANTTKGMRPSFSNAASPVVAEGLFDYLCLAAKQQYQRVGTGQFSADMQVSLVNDGPATFWLQVP